MNTMSKGRIPIIASRRAIERLSSKHPQHFLLQRIKQDVKKDDSPWPVSMQRAGYTAIALAVPYTLSVFVAESPRLREYLEGDLRADDVTTKTIGSRIVDFVRWYWGRQDDIPYPDFVQNQNHGELSLPGDLTFMKRKEQEKIQDRLSEEVLVCVETDDEHTERVCENVIGNLPASRIPNILSMSHQKFQQSNTSHLYVTFPNDDLQDTMKSRAQEDHSFTLLDGEQEGREENMAQAREIANLTSIWSTWYHFPNTTPPSLNQSDSTSNSSSVSARKRQVDTYQPFIDQMSHEIDLLEKDLRDPQCIRDRDEMESQIQLLKQEIKSLRRERRIQKLKQMFSFIH